MKNILIDTDVILDFFFDRKPFSDNSEIILSFCESNKLKGFITPVICSNLYYLLRQSSKHEKVIEKLSQLLTFIDVLQMDKEIVLNAINSKFKDFEDALQNFAAVKSSNIDVIITRNIKDFKTSEIGVMTPDNFIKSINASR
ncbi:type II toxin-antitoxin system VapC family toxin [Roseimarinus sediminis]|uniref:type II toxin-antitoxin system VapC family toxin n=1 Tax=Roseimarinus sediminis TaxID=1610899 RepID=UPI003D196638